MKIVLNCESSSVSNDVVAALPVPNAAVRPMSQLLVEKRAAAAADWDKRYEDRSEKLTKEIDWSSSAPFRALRASAPLMSLRSFWMQNCANGKSSFGDLPGVSVEEEDTNESLSKLLGMS